MIFLRLAAYLQSTPWVLARISSFVFTFWESCSVIRLPFPGKTLINEPSPALKTEIKSSSKCILVFSGKCKGHKQNQSPTDWQTDRCRTKWSLCVTMLHRQHKNYVGFEFWRIFSIRNYERTKYTWAPQTVHNTPVMNILKGYFYLILF